MSLNCGGVIPFNVTVEPGVLFRREEVRGMMLATRVLAAYFLGVRSKQERIEI